MVFSFDKYSSETKDGSIPQFVVSRKPEQIIRGPINSAMQQTWDWPEKEAVVKRCRFKIIVSDFHAKGLDNITRLKLFNTCLASVLKGSSCMGILWSNSVKLVSPQMYMQALKAKDVQDYLYGALNVRLFPTGENGSEFVMDTLGLGAFGLPDLQCHFKGFSPEEVAGVLINYGYYIFEKGDVIGDGHTVQGIKDEHKWTCRHEVSMAHPQRRVVDLNPEELNSAGNRA